ncbi:hypothetical protein KOW79_002063 [Hemibagrus wyckioides]|uniref:Group XIIA secretory phospholipase A2 n=1 Tax=Hemibagrus wyckioides TaxID=337641 RepID=A0A9D3P307_9TELE|nr:group XIIA secretory phospholipase A2-like [Hemibagrus wyckioides]KAG7333656.1 hypothetical protein KOW79_002063 [Hemibagrus wyckioides]
MKKLRVSVLLLLLWGTLMSSAGLKDSKHKAFDWTEISETFKDFYQKFHKYHRYYKFIKYALEIFLRPNESCQFKCPDGGEKPFPRPGHRPSANGCGSHVFGSPFNAGIPFITSCCDQHDRCYDTCGQKKADCDEQFQGCLNNICGDLVILGGESVQVCELAVSLTYDAVMYLGCKAYLTSQSAACVCKKKTEL